MDLYGRVLLLIVVAFVMAVKKCHFKNRQLFRSLFLPAGIRSPPQFKQVMLAIVFVSVIVTICSIAIV